MKIYNYHPITGEYVSESMADKSPLEPGKYLIPACATNKQPLPQQENKTVCFINNDWEYVDIPQPEPEPELTAEQIAQQTKQRMTQFVQSILDSEAQKHNYDNIVSATSYAGYVNQFQAEGIAFGVWRSAVWAKCYEIMADVLSDKRQVPTEEQLIAELPKLTL